MTDETKTEGAAPKLRLIVNENFVDHVQIAAKELADRLEGEYKSRTATQTASSNICIDVSVYPEDDKVVERTVAELAERGYYAEPVEYNCAGGRAGAFWLTPSNPNRR